jgi:23S rRNA pseudouridine2604 synthase
MTDVPGPTRRLDRCVIELTGCSRREAENYIAGGWVRVDGEVVEQPQFPVSGQAVTIDAGASAAPAETATMLLHQPAGQDAASALASVVPGSRWDGDPSGWRLLHRHFHRLQAAMPLPPEASGLAVFSQDHRVLRHLGEAGPRLEQEWLVEVEGELAPYGWKRLSDGTKFQGWPVAPFKVSWQSEQRLRFAIKGVRPGLLEWLCAEVGLRATALRRLRIGRIALAKMPPASWRYLLPSDRF